MSEVPLHKLTGVDFWHIAGGGSGQGEQQAWQEEEVRAIFSSVFFHLGYPRCIPKRRGVGRGVLGWSLRVRAIHVVLHVPWAESPAKSHAFGAGVPR